MQQYKNPQIIQPQQTGISLPSNGKCLHSPSPRFSNNSNSNNNNNNHYYYKKHEIKKLQKTAVLGTTHILWKVVM
jgi:hypothetical protein